MTRLFTGDYSTGDFTQWDQIATKTISDKTTGTPYRYPSQGLYSAQVLPMGDCGYYARYEVRDGDIPPFGGYDRAEVIGGAGDVSLVGTTRWYAFSIKFDPTFPSNHHELGWGLVHQFHDYPNKMSSPVLGLGWDLAANSAQYQADHWYLYQVPQSAPFTADGPHVPIAEFPMDKGNWNDIRMQIKWMQDDTGFVNIWYNGQPHTLMGGGTTWIGQTVCPSGGPGQEVTGILLQQGYYREGVVNATGIVYHRGLRVADNESSL